MTHAVNSRCRLYLFMVSPSDCSGSKSADFQFIADLLWFTSFNRFMFMSAQETLGISLRMALIATWLLGVMLHAFT